MSRIASSLGTIAMIAAMVGIYAVGRALITAGGLFAAMPTVTPSGTAARNNASEPDLLESRLHYCEGDRIYALLSVPLDAIFHMSVGTSDVLKSNGNAGGEGIPVTGSAATTASKEATENRVGEGACEEVERLDDRRLVLCWGQAPSHFTIIASNSLGSRAYALPLVPCGRRPTETTPDRQPAGTSVHTPRP